MAWHGMGGVLSGAAWYSTEIHLVWVSYACPVLFPAHLTYAILFPHTQPMLFPHPSSHSEFFCSCKSSSGETRSGERDEGWSFKLRSSLLNPFTHIYI